MGVTFAATIWNPNYTRRTSFYLRKVNCLYFGYGFYLFGSKREHNQYSNMLYRINDYLPMEVRQGLKYKDYRYLMLFDWTNPGRELFDPVTGKSLS